MLSADEVRVFLAKPDVIRTRTGAEDVLSPDDLSHVARFKFDADRDQARASRVVQRLALSACGSVSASGLRFEATPGGKPRVAMPAEARALEFSVSNTRGLVACAVALERPVGIDVECLRPEIPSGVVRRCWSARDIETLNDAPVQEQSRRFVEMWTVKEAYAKARGLGLTVDLRHVTVRATDGEHALDLDASLGDDAANWMVKVWSPTPTHVMAVCVQVSGSPCDVREEWFEAGGDCSLASPMPAPLSATLNRADCGH